MRWDRIAELGCQAPETVTRHHGYITIHHCGTGAGGRKNHDKVAGLCWGHHLGDNGINSLTGKISRREWENINITEAEMLEKVAKQLGEK